MWHDGRKWHPLLASALPVPKNGPPGALAHDEKRGCANAAPNGQLSFRAGTRTNTSCQRARRPRGHCPGSPGGETKEIWAMSGRLDQKLRSGFATKARPAPKL